MAKNKNYTIEQLEWLKRVRKKTRNPQLTQKFNAKFGTNISPETLTALCLRNGWVCELPRGREFGHTPWNKGIKTGITPVGCFKKGRANPKKKPIGSEIRRSKQTAIKVAETGDFACDYILKSRYIYQQHFGAIPRGYVIRHKDGNALNFDIDNLEAISGRENALLNKLGFQHEPDELKPALREFIRLKSKIHEMEAKYATN